MAKTEGSRDGFFNRGWTRALFRDEGKEPVDREKLMMFKMVGPTASKFSFRNDVGIMSSGQEEEFM